MQDTQKPNSTPEGMGNFSESPKPGGKFAKVVFDKKCVLVKAIINDREKDLKVKIVRHGSKVTFEVKWKDFEAKLTKDFGYNIPPFLNEYEFTKLYKTPIEYYKAIVSIIENLAADEYVKAQKVYEEEQR